MHTSMADINNSKRGRPLANTTGLMVRVPQDLLAALDRFIAEECAPETSRPEALRLAFRDWAVGHGYLENSPPKEDAN